MTATGMEVGGLCSVCRNWFVRDIVRGRFSVQDGALCEVDGAVPGQYVRIVGSRFHDGVFRYPSCACGDDGCAQTDEEFDGAVWLMAPPPDFLALCRDIADWEAQSGRALETLMEASPYRSESFGGYEYTRADGTGDLPFGWRDERLGFVSRLNRWRKV